MAGDKDECEALAGAHNALAVEVAARLQKVVATI
jgi:hypothetical protein